MFESWSSYTSSYNLGHRALAGLFAVPLVIQEKVDGSQFSFGVDPDTLELRCRSRVVEINLAAPEALFVKAIETAKALASELTPGWTYRGEYLAKPKHNALAYDRVPVKHIILFDVNTGSEEYLSYDRLGEEAKRLGLEVVPTLAITTGGSSAMADMLRGLLNTPSILGGQKIEGLVMKQATVSLYDERSKKALMGKFVSEAFREVHKSSWATENPGKNDVIANAISAYGTQSRWQKAAQHMREAGTLTDDVKDIGPLIHETQADVEKECSEEIKAMLWKWAWPHIKRGLTAQLPTWYKDLLLKKQFEEAAKTEAA